MADANHLDRRGFTRQCLGGIGAAALVSTSASGDDQPPPPALPEDPKKISLAQTPPPEALLLFALLQQYPSDHYNEDNVQAIARDVAGDLARGRQLRAYPLQNSDEPATVFRAFRAATVQEALP